MKTVFRNVPAVFIGCFFCALSASYFVAPAGLLAGGCTGIGLALNGFCGLSVSAGIWCASIFFFLLGLFVLGREYAMNILVGSLGYPLCFSLTSAMVAATGVLTDDIFLCVVFGGLCNALGAGIILRVGASMGATDVPAMILSRRFGISISASLYAFDALILCLQMPFSEPRRILYGLLFVMIYSVLAGKVILLGQDKLQIQIHSPRYEEISTAILKTLDRGCTLVHIQGGYTREESFAVQTVVTKRQLFRVRETALRIDPQAFLIINPVSDVNGRGFTLSKYADTPQRP